MDASLRWHDGKAGALPAFSFAPRPLVRLAMHKAFLAFLVAAVIAVPVAARDLTLERLFQSPSLSGPVPRQPKLSPDGRLVTLLRNRADEKDRYDLWAIDAATGAARMLVDSKKVGTGGEISEEEKMRRER